MTEQPSTPSAPDVDQPQGGSHDGETDERASGRTPHTQEPAEGADDPAETGEA